MDGRSQEGFVAILLTQAPCIVVVRAVCEAEEASSGAGVA